MAGTGRFHSRSAVEEGYEHGGGEGSEGECGGGEGLEGEWGGVSRTKITKEDGTEWPWNCFMVT